MVSTGLEVVFENLAFTVKTYHVTVPLLSWLYTKIDISYSIKTSELYHTVYKVDT